MFLTDVSVRRPVFATVMSLALVVIGLVGYSRLPVREVPDIEFPIVSVSTVLPGASPEVVETEITEILEEELNGIKGVDFISSESKEQVSSIIVQFDLDRDIDAATQDVRDRVSRVRGRLPDDAEEPLVAKYDVNAGAIMWLALYSPTRSRFEISDLADSFLKPRLQTVSGVGRVIVGGSNSQAMRVELQRDLLAAYELTVSEVVDALRTQNVEVPSGRVEGQWREFVVKTEGEVSTPEQFERLIVAYRNDQPIRLGSVASVRKGYENERTGARYNGSPTTGLGIVKQSDANTLSVAARVKERVEELKQELPDGYQLQVAFDQSGFIERSVREVQQTLLIAGVLVLIVIFVFLQSLRSTLIPSITMPVAIIATFGVMYFLGFTINNLTLMALTLVIGVVVDDAIIVLENIYRHMEEGADRREAAQAASSEIAFAVISTTLTLIAVFVPIAFLSGIVGRFFFEFGISVAVAVGASSFVALTMTPMLCSRFLSSRSTAARSGFFGDTARRFDRMVSDLSAKYQTALAWALSHRGYMVAIVLGSLALSGVLFFVVGKEFLPSDDRGYFQVYVSTPEGSTLAYHDRQQRAVEQHLDDTSEVRSYFSIVALGRGGPGAVNKGMMFVRNHPKGPLRDKSSNEVITDMRAKTRTIAGADVGFGTFNPLTRGTSSKALEFVIQSSDFDELGRYANLLKARLSEVDGFSDVETNLEINKPQLNVAIDRDKAGALGISAADVGDTLRVLLGGDAVSTFKRGNERYDVMVQLAAADRFSPQDLSNIYVRTDSGELVQLANVVAVEETVGPSSVNHYDRRRSVVVEANLEGIDLGRALDKVSAMAAALLPEGFSTTVRGQAREFKRGSSGLSFTFVLAVIAIYLALAAQFESFIHPLTIMLALPMAMFGALVGLAATGMTLNIYSFIGIIMLMGLVTKNSILLVDYINILRAEGLACRDAILKAGGIRLRPILMTAISTVFGILPIAIGFGAGAEGRRPLGVAVVVGMTTSTLLTLLVVPVFYSLFDALTARVGKRAHARRTAAKAQV